MTVLSSVAEVEAATRIQKGSWEFIWTGSGRGSQTVALPISSVKRMVAGHECSGPSGLEITIFSDRDRYRKHHLLWTKSGGCSPGWISSVNTLDLSHIDIGGATAYIKTAPSVWWTIVLGVQQ